MFLCIEGEPIAINKLWIIPDNKTSDIAVCAGVQQVAETLIRRVLCEHLDDIQPSADRWPARFLMQPQLMQPLLHRYLGRAKERCALRHRQLIGIRVIATQILNSLLTCKRSM